MGFIKHITFYFADRRNVNKAERQFAVCCACCAILWLIEEATETGFPPKPALVLLESSSRSS